ncbi:hypothetical protein N8865_02385, partial [Francisellaceae bacterium]|nr:hypothetical protein [Francisellaceae bacterium]
SLHKKDFTFTVKQNTPYQAPIQKGQMLGELQISYQGKIIETTPLIALSEISKGSLWQRIKGKVSLWLA